MKNIIPFILFLTLAFTKVGAQELTTFDNDDKKTQSKWVFKLGTNLVDNRGGQRFLGGLSSPDQSAFGKLPLTIGLEKRLNNLFGIRSVLSFNSWDAGSGIIDSQKLTQDVPYYSSDFAVSLYVDQLFMATSKLEWLDVYVHGGVGFFNITEDSFSYNIGAGFSIWITDNLALDFDAVSKIAFKNELFNSTHSQYSFGLLFNLGKGSIKKTSTIQQVQLDNKDSDGDGISDDKDNCPIVSGPSSNNGCPLPDSDGDGVFDSIDKCPNQIGLVYNNGCPVSDTDGDGIIDKMDTCPNQAGVLSNNGCPEQKKEIIKSTIKTKSSLIPLTKKIDFTSGNYNFTQETYPFLIKIVKALLKEPNNVRFKIVGHTDSQGKYSLNRTLSTTRANAVRNYLVDNGISKDRIETLGLGESEPIDNNFTEEGRANNRRVEIFIIK